MPNAKGLLVEIFRSSYTSVANLTDTRQLTEVVLIGDGIPGLVEANEDHPAFKLVTRNIMGTIYKHIEPVERPSAGFSGWMFGGHIAYTSDSRWSELVNAYPLKIHDRSESRELNSVVSL